MSREKRTEGEGSAVFGNVQPMARTVNVICIQDIIFAAWLNAVHLKKHYHGAEIPTGNKRREIILPGPGFSSDKLNASY
ncbi:hypothetical protein GWD52_14210 [Enterobacteriaceae bacterium 4M9]|nr:hypothetical protein [Enterobacteriaceae bacterium 4M9]